MNGLIHIIIFDREDPYTSYYVGEPQLLNGGSGLFGGGFDSDISKAISFDNILLAYIDRKRLEKMYADIPAKMRVITMTTKELFKKKLGARQ